MENWDSRTSWVAAAMEDEQCPEALAIVNVISELACGRVQKQVLALHAERSRCRSPGRSPPSQAHAGGGNPVCVTAQAFTYLEQGENESVSCSC